MQQNTPRLDHHRLENLENRCLLSGDIQTVTLDIGATPESVIFADFTGDGI
ncbi:hypothetical protein MNBD_PLANCTO03-655, partial [hydrothermal vent metagenome]